MLKTEVRFVVSTMVGLMVLLLGDPVRAQTIELLERDATVWLAEQVVEGKTEASSGLLYVNDVSFPFEVADSTFAVPIHLKDGENTIVACTDGSDTAVCSDTLRWSLGYSLEPEVYAWATVTDRLVTLHGRLLANPDSTQLTFNWIQDPSNPASVEISPSGDTTATVNFPGGVPAGEYYFELEATSTQGNTARARTFITVYQDSVRAFDIWNDYAAWIDSAIVYEILPDAFTSGGKLADVTRYLPELKLLGVNTLWLQPIYVWNEPGMGYDVVNYFEIRSNLGTKNDLRDLVDSAHDLGMRVILDIVPNHTSINHPYARDAVKWGPLSHYYDFYQRTVDDAPYSRDYHRRTVGNMDFIYYFWDALVNLNYNNPEVSRWFTEVCQYWVENFDIDGYRMDAVWGVNARSPEAMRNLRFDLKRIKPEILFLAEDKATDPDVFDRRFDVAFDWYPEEDWVSHWTWQIDYAGNDNPTFFNSSNVNGRTRLLRDALTNRGNGYAPNARVLRFMENNDLSRFMASHTLEQTKMAAALLFSLPGVPSMYMGQEIGFKRHPYTEATIYITNKSLAEHDPYGLVPYYQDVIFLRKSFAALRSDNFAEVTVEPAAIAGHTYAYHRWHDDQNIFGVINMAGNPVNAQLKLPVDQLGLIADETYYLTDLMTGEYIQSTGTELAGIEIPVNGHTTRLFILDDHVVSVPTPIEQPDFAENTDLKLAQNYPNPFTTSTSIAFTLPGPGRVVLEVYDLLGRKVDTIIDRETHGGRHEVFFDSGQLASGLYVYRLHFGSQTLTRRMLIVR